MAAVYLKSEFYHSGIAILDSKYWIDTKFLQVIVVFVWSRFWTTHEDAVRLSCKNLVSIQYLLSNIAIL